MAIDQDYKHDVEIFLSAKKLFVRPKVYGPTIMPDVSLRTVQ